MDKISDYAALYAMIIVIVGGAVALGLLYASAKFFSAELVALGSGRTLNLNISADSAAFGRDRGATQVTQLGVLEHKVDRIDRAAEHADGVDSLIQVLARRVNGRVAHD